MAVKTKISGLAHGPGFSAGYGQVTRQALLIYACKFRQFGLKIVALAAFFLDRPAEYRPGGILAFTDLIVRIVTRNASVKSLPGHRILTGVATFDDLLNYIFMAGRTVVSLKKIRYASIDIGRIRMAAFHADIDVAILTGQLSVNGYVKTLMVNQPRTFNAGR